MKTTKEYTTKVGSDTIIVPMGASVSPMKLSDGRTQYNVTEASVLAQQNSHDRKYRFVTVPAELIEES